MNEAPERGLPEIKHNGHSDPEDTNFSELEEPDGTHLNDLSGGEGGNSGKKQIIPGVEGSDEEGV